MTTTSLTLRVRISGTQHSSDVLDSFERLAEIFELSPKNWGATSSGDQLRPGGLVELRRYVVAHDQKIEAFSVFEDPRVVLAAADKFEGAWRIDVMKFDADTTWLSKAVGALRGFPNIPSMLDAAVSRHEPGHLQFAPSPPIAQSNYAVLTTDAQVAAAYDDPSVFWDCWSAVEDVKGHKLCTRALDSLGYEAWLGWTFEGSMALARAARPHLTEYPWIQLSGMEGPWWDFGDVQWERAGWPMLDLVGYEPRTETVELAAKPGHDGHVLLQEIDTIRQLVSRGKTRDKKPVKCVRVVFLDEATARVEKRPLLDVGAKVYYMGKQAELVELTY